MPTPAVKWLLQKMPRRRSFTFQGEVDPLALAMRPPSNETPQEKLLREQNEKEARRISEQIDDQIRSESLQIKKANKSIVKVLLLGQGESGKSTTLKNFRLAYAPDAFAAERASWKAVIHLNLIRTILHIIDEVKEELALYATSSQGASMGKRTSSYSSIHRMGSRPTSPPRSPPTSPIMNDSYSSFMPLTPPPLHNSDDNGSLESPTYEEAPDISALNVLVLRLSPLRSVETELKKQLGGAAEEVVPEEGATCGVLGFEAEVTSSRPGGRRKMTQEWGIRASRWKRGSADDSPDRQPRLSTSKISVPLLSSLEDDIQKLWTYPAVRTILRRRHQLADIEESPGGFFLQSLHRIVSSNYVPSDLDVMRARLRTMGVQETRIWFAGALIGPDFGREWLLYDVGGSRTMRQAWIPFFDNMNAIIFLAPISCFDERLVEDDRVNRLEDSLQLWSSLCSSKLIPTKTTLILFLNKCDLLERKLVSGIQIRDYLPSYGDRENTTRVATKYFKQKFKDIIVQKSKQPRVCYIYPTSVTDTSATRKTLETVKDGILRDHLRHADFM